MAAPHVTGAAGLLFSLKPTATVAEVRSALLGSVDPIASLAGNTTTGGRLDVAAALDRLVPPVVVPPVVAPPIAPVAPPPACKVPKLKGKTLAQATKALKSAHCRVGSITKPRKRKGHKLPPLVVASSSPKAGRLLANGAKVKLTLAPKPKKKPKHHHR
jgi:subtilisin family serine protease